MFSRNALSYVNLAVRNFQAAPAETFKTIQLIVCIM